MQIYGLEINPYSESAVQQCSRIAIINPEIIIPGIKTFEVVIMADADACSGINIKINSIAYQPLVAQVEIPAVFGKPGVQFTICHTIIFYSVFGFNDCCSIAPNALAGKYKFWVVHKKSKKIVFANISHIIELCQIIIKLGQKKPGTT